MSDPAGWDGLYGQADRALYRAKNDGRNRVRSHKIEAKPSYKPKRPKPKARLG